MMISITCQPIQIKRNLCIKINVLLLCISLSFFNCYLLVGCRNRTSDFVKLRVDSKDDSKERIFDVDPNPDAPFPRVVWLMSYPNSGTSFTMRLVHQASKRAVATNYGSEENVFNENVPLYSNSPNGPYILHPNETLPEEYILTKTHCGGRCVDCEPVKYIETLKTFMKRCAQGHRKNTNYRDNKEIVQYHPSIVQRAIHIIRNPFDNLVSNFHLEWKNKLKANRTEWLESYPNDLVGFRRWCFDQDSLYSEKEKELLPEDVVNIFQKGGIPCRAHFFRYAMVSIDLSNYQIIL